MPASRSAPRVVAPMPCDPLATSPRRTRPARGKERPLVSADPLPRAACPRRGPRLVVLAAMLVGLAAGLVDLSPRVARAAAAWTTTDLNLRSGPGTDYGVILVMPAGAYVEIVENQQNGFYRVRYDGV